MPADISLGLMEQPVMREETLTEEEERYVQDILSRVTHVEGKYLGTLAQMKALAQRLSDVEVFALHAQYPSEGEGVLNLVHSDFRSMLGEGFTDVLSTFDPDWFSLHLGFACEIMKSGGQFGFEVGVSEILPEETVRQRIIENVDWVRSTFLKRGEIILENLDYNPKELSGTYEHVCEPAFIADCLEQTGCGMLMDIGHAVVSSRNMGYDDVNAYLDKLPLEKVVEIHMSGAGTKDGLAHDSHHPITAEGQPEAGLLESVLASGRMTGLRAVTLETFEDVPAQLDLLKDILERTA